MCTDSVYLGLRKGLEFVLVVFTCFLMNSEALENIFLLLLLFPLIQLGRNLFYVSCMLYSRGGDICVILAAIYHNAIHEGISCPD